MGTGKPRPKHNIAAGLMPLATSIRTPKLDPENARLHSDANIDSIAGSLAEYGQRTPIVVNKRTGFIEKGNGTFVAARKLGWTSIAVLFVVDSDEAATGYAIADNRTAELAEWDWERLQGQFSTLVAAGFRDTLVATGWDEEELRMYLEGNFSPAPAGELPGAPDRPESMVLKIEGAERCDVIRRVQALAEVDNAVDAVLAALQVFIEQRS